VPHKLFHSLLSGKPTLVSTAPPLARIAKETGGAFVFEAENPTSLSKVTFDIYNKKEEVAKRCAAGLKATEEGTYNWDEDQKILVNLYTRLAQAESKK